MKNFLRHNGIWVLIIARLLTAAISIGSGFVPDLTGPAGRVLGAFVSLLVTELIRAGWMLYSGAGSFGIICRLAGVELAYSLVLTLPAYPLFRFVHQKLGTY